MNGKLNFKIFLYFFFLIYFFIGLMIYKDYGVGLEEHFQRQNGFYWLNHFFSLTNFEDFKSLVNMRYQEIISADPNLPDPNFFNFYGIAFDLPLAFIETLFDLDSSKIYFELRHFATFFIFFISSIFFYRIIKNRIKNNLIIFLGLFFYISSPRIFGDSFHNNKDILFLSILTIAISYLFKLFEKYNNKNLLLFCFFSAIASSSRIMGIYLPLMLIIFYFLEFLIQNFSFKNFLHKSIKVLIIFYFFLLLHYPYSWELNIFEFKKWFQNFFYWMDIEVLFNGNYYMIKYLPRSYLPTWIAISTPTIILLLFLIGSYKVVKTIIKRIISIDFVRKNNKKGDLWRSLNEKKDLFIVVSFFSFLSYAVLLNVAMLSGWRHFYFLHIFIIYLATIGLNYVYKNLFKNFNLKIIYLLFSFIIINLIHINYNFHPYQSLYFNGLLNSNMTKKFQVDTPNLSRADALKFIIKNEDSNKERIFVANASWTPMYNGKDMLEEHEQDKLIFVGQEFDQADYIYTNYVFKSDEKYNKNYKIPKKFDKIKDFKINDVLIYSIYKSKK